jgi:hypothetical protein
MRLPKDDMQWVIEVPSHLLKRPGTVKTPAVGSRKGVLQLEGYGVTATRFICLVATCKCSGYTAVRFMGRREWFGYAQNRCRVCEIFGKPRRLRPELKTAPKGWGIM